MQLRSNVAVSTLAEELDRAVPDLLARYHVPGLSIAIIQNNALALTRGYGVRSQSDADRITVETVFEGASFSKPIFAAAALQLWEHGALDLDWPLAEYLPEPDRPEDPAIRQITARMVLSHTTGLPNWRREGGRLRTLRPPGTTLTYSGEGFVYLQQVVEHLTGESLDPHVRRTVLAPLGMSATSYLWRDTYDALAAQPHRDDGSPRSRYESKDANAAASVHTTPRDLAYLIQAILATTSGQPTILRPETVAEMLRPQVRLARHPSVAWGLGWGLQHTPAGESFWHNGDNPGFKNFAIGYPAEQFGVVIMTNGDNGTAVYKRLLRTLIGGTYPAFAIINSLSLRDQDP